MRRTLAVFVFLSAAALAQTGEAGGARWTNSGDGLTGSVAGISALVIDQATGSALYALTSTSIIFKSTDGGANWKALGNMAGVNVLALDPTSASTIYAGTAHGVVTTLDGGESWAAAGLSNTSVSNLAVDPITPSTLYAGSYGHLYKSTDRGGNWTDLNLGPPPGGTVQTDLPVSIDALVLDPLTPSTLYVATGRGLSGNILKSLDGGKSWNVIDANAGPFYSGPQLVIDPSTPSTLYRINPIRKSTDGGATWTSIGFTNPATNAGYLVTALAVDPGNSKTLYLSTIVSAEQAIFKSTDGGQSWNAVDTTIPPAGSFVFSPGSRTIYAATGGGVFKSTDAGTNWGEANTGLRALNIRILVGDPVAAATIYAGGDEGLFKSADSGGNWKEQAAFLVFCCAGGSGPFPQAVPAGVHSLLIDFTNPNILYLATARPGGCFSADVLLYKSPDGAETWSDSISAYSPTSGCEAAGLMAMDPTDPKTLYLRWNDYDDGYGLLKSTDGGAHWKYIPLFADVENTLVIDPTTPTTLYLGTDLGVSQSTDGGAAWNVVGLANSNVNLLAVDPHQPNVLYAGTTTPGPQPPGFQGLYKSTDHGATWSPINTGLDDIVSTRAPVNALIPDPDHRGVLYLASSGHGVFKSSDGGDTWAPFNDGLTFLDVRVLALVPGAHSTVYAGTPGGVFKLVEEDSRPRRVQK